MTRLDEYGPTSAITEADLLRGYRGTGPEPEPDDEPEPDPETEGREGWPEFTDQWTERPIERW